MRVGAALSGWREITGAIRPASQILVSTQITWKLVKCRFGFSSFRLGPGSPISDKLPADAKTLHLLTTLTLNSKGEDHARNLDFILSETGKKLLKGCKQVSDVNPVVAKITLVS